MKKIIVVLFGLNMLLASYSLCSIWQNPQLEETVMSELTEDLDAPGTPPAQAVLGNLVTVTNSLEYSVSFSYTNMNDNTVIWTVPAGMTKAVDLSGADFWYPIYVTIQLSQNSQLDPTFGFHLPEGLNLLNVCCLGGSYAVLNAYDNAVLN